MDSHQQQQESPRATTGVEDKVSGLLLRQAILQTNLPRLWRRTLRNDLKGHGGEDLLGRLLCLALLLDDNELYFMPQAVRAASEGAVVSAAWANGVARKGGADR